MIDCIKHMKIDFIYIFRKLISMNQIFFFNFYDSLLFYIEKFLEHDLKYWRLK